MSGCDGRDVADAKLDELPARVLAIATRVSSRLPSVIQAGKGTSGRTADVPVDVSIEDRRQNKAMEIYRILEDNGGRVYQTDIVAATDWSKGTVSRALQEMEQAGEVVRLEIGREKVVCTPKSLPQGVGLDSLG